ncbi:MAG TPA: hypothetical protein VHC69_04390 [Polyangiaceae bacterium]|nr:hypothetical protein [Polyangiaceae bacterium]
MTFGAVSSDHWAGDAPNANNDARAIFLSEARAGNLLWVELMPPRPAVRGRLCLLIEGAIERALDARGAPPPSELATTTRDEIVADQIRRALVSGTSGIALWLSSLEAIAGPDLALDTGDSRTLCFWLDTASERPVRLGFDAVNRSLGVYLPPRSLQSLLDESEPGTDEQQEAEPVAAEAAGREPYSAGFDTDPSELGPSSQDLTVDDRMLAARAHAAAEAAQAQAPSEEPAAPAEEANGVEERPRPTTAESTLAETARAMAEEIAEDSDTGWLRHALIDLSTPEPVVAQRPSLAVPDLVVPRITPLPRRETTVAASGAPAPDHHAEPHAPTPDHHAEPHAPAGATVAERTVDVNVEAKAPDADGNATSSLGAEGRQPAEAAPSAQEDADAAVAASIGPRLELRLADVPETTAPNATDVEAETKRKLETCWRELSAATGPKPLAVVERLFSSAYMPLRAALDRGADMPALRETADDWSQSFEKSYKDGFDALRVRNKRPAMVVDVPDLALRVARLHGARTTQLLLVDSLRYDLGEMVNARIAAIVGQRAACAERFLLWAALPTNTATQIELIGRGPAGLREPITATNDELIVGRGRKAQMVRRLKTGHRELLKLDIVAARLTEPHGNDPNGFEAIADEVGQRIAAHFEGLQPRTLVMIFGDHGFTVDHHTDGRPSVTEGGASPEEVLVPAFAWLVGAVH